MGRVIVVVLMLATVGLAEPVLVLESGADTVLADVHLAQREFGTVDLFYNARSVADSVDVVRHTAYGLDSHAASTEDLLVYGHWQWDLNDAADDGAGSWYLAIAGDERHPYYTDDDSNRTLLLRGQDELLETALVHQGLLHWGPDSSDSYLRGMRLVARDGGGVVMSGIDFGEQVIEPGHFSEPYNHAQARFYPAGSVALEREVALLQEGWADPGANPHILELCSATRDTVVLLFGDWSYMDGTIHAPPGTEETPRYYLFYPVTPKHPKLWITRGGSWLVSSDWSSGMGVPWYAPSVLLLPAVGEWTDAIGFLGVTDTLDAVAFHPDYGFASLQLDSPYLWLARVDTAATEVQARDTVTVCAAGWEIREATVEIAADGQVFVAWLERELSAPHVMRLFLSAVDWQSALVAEDPPSALLPSSSLLHTFPNPFNSTLRIAYELPRAEQIELSVFNTLGQQVARLAEGRAAAGRHTVSWAPATGAGLYFVTLRAGGDVWTDKVLYVK